MKRLLRIFVSAVISKPDVEALFDEYERECTFLICKTNPYFTGRRSDMKGNVNGATHLFMRRP
jgi:hypothetical protein